MKILKFSHGPGQARSFKNKPKGKCKKKGGDLEKRKRGGSLRENPSLFPAAKAPGGRIFSNKGVTADIYVYIPGRTRYSTRANSFLLPSSRSPDPRESLAPKAERGEQIGASNEQHRLINPPRAIE